MPAFGIKRTVQPRVLSGIGARKTSRKCHLPKIDVRAVYNGPYGFRAISIDRLIQPLVIQATLHWKKYLAELPSMCGYFVLLKVGHPRHTAISVR